MELGRREGGRLKTWKGQVVADRMLRFFVLRTVCLTILPGLSLPRLPGMQNISNCALWEPSF